MSDDTDLSFADDRLADWNRRAKIWYSLYYILGTLALVLTITVASRPHFISRDADWPPTIAWLAAIFQGLSTFLVALPKAAAYRAAWRTLWLARLEYLDSPQDENRIKNLRYHIARGWSQIDGGYTDPSAKPRVTRAQSSSRAQGPTNKADK